VKLRESQKKINARPSNKVDARLFGQLIRRKMEDLGYTLQSLAVAVFNDEHRISQISELVGTPRATTVIPRTVGAFKKVLGLTEADIDACRVATPAAANPEVDRLIGTKEIDEPTRTAIDNAISEIKAELANAQFANDILKGIVNQFLDSVGRSNTQPVVWPSTLRDLASEFIVLQEQFRRKQNVPEKISALNREIGAALAAGRFEEARQKAESINRWAEIEYIDQLKTFEHSADVFAKSLSSSAYILMLEGHFEQARAVYIRILKLEGVSEQYIARASKSATVSFSASIARSDSLETARGVFDEMRKADIAPNVVTFNTLINLAEDYDTARGVFDEMRKADIAPNVVTFSTLINLAEDYDTARGVFDEMRKADIAPNVVTVTTVLAKAPDFVTGLSFVDSLDKTLPIFSHGLYCALYAKDIVHLDSTKLIEIYLGGFRQFGEALESPINQYRRARRPADAFRVALIAPHTGAARRFFTDRYAVCLPLFRSAMEAGEDDGNLHYAFGIAAALNKDWAIAKKHLPIARERAYHPARVEYIDRLLRQSPPSFRVEQNRFA
jgi:pentatricopeptide repeat protein